MIDSNSWICRHGLNLNYVLLRIDVFMVWRHHTFPGCASRCPSSLVALTYARLCQVNFWFPLAKRKQLDQGLLQLPAQLPGTICQSNFRIQPTVTVSQLSKWNWKHIFHANVDQILTFIFIYFLFFWMVDLCYWYVLWECSFREHANTLIIIIIIINHWFKS